jgi:hypothetical protein
MTAKQIVLTVAAISAEGILGLAFLPGRVSSDSTGAVDKAEYNRSHDKSPAIHFGDFPGFSDAEPGRRVQGSSTPKLIRMVPNSAASTQVSMRTSSSTIAELMGVNMKIIHDIDESEPQEKSPAVGRGLTKKDPTFQRMDLEETFRWFFNRATYLRTKRLPAEEAIRANSLNDDLMIAYRRESRSFEGELMAHKGDAVEWPATVLSIGREWVSIRCTRSRKFQPDQNQSPTAQLSVMFAEDPKGLGIGTDFSMFYDGNGSLPVAPVSSATRKNYGGLGPQISKDYAKTLRRGDSIRISGTITNVKTEMSRSTHYIYLCVGGAKVMEPAR